MTSGIILQLFYHHLGGGHIAAWRDPAAPENPAMNFEAILETVRKAEDAKVHMVFLADSLAFWQRSDETLSRLSMNAAFEHITLCTALAQRTEKIGFVITGNTTYNDPYILARQYSSLDHLSHGRVGWNIVTSGNPAEAANFGHGGSALGHDERYARAGEFVEVAKGLWDGWDDDALIRDRASGIFSRQGGVRPLRHEGAYFKVAGPLTLPRMPQGHPVLCQAGQSPAGKRFAAEHAELVISVHHDLAQGRAFYDEMKGLAEGFGRDRDSLKIIPNINAVLGRTEAEAQDRMALLDSLTDMVPGVDQLSTFLHTDLRGYPLDGPVPEIEDVKLGSQGVQSYFREVIRRDNLTVRQAAMVGARFGCLAFSAKGLVDHIEEWVNGGAADGFNLAFTDLGHSVDVLVEQVIPELRRRGLFQDDYKGLTLREHLGLARPASPRV